MYRKTNTKEEFKSLTEYIHKLWECKNYTKNINVSNINGNVVKTILDKQYHNPVLMMAIVCYISSIIKTNSTNKNIVAKVSSTIRNWLKYTEYVAKGEYGVVYKSKLNNSDVIIKTLKSPKDMKEEMYKAQYYDLFREYFIGYICLNKMRYTSPVFAYTLGGFICPVAEEPNNFCKTQNDRDSIYVLTENIEGENMVKMIKHISFKNWLDIYLQILLGLENAQRKFKFTHWDLHPGNVMVRKIHLNIVINTILTAIHMK